MSLLENCEEFIEQNYINITNIYPIWAWRFHPSTGILGLTPRLLRPPNTWRVVGGGPSRVVQQSGEKEKDALKAISKLIAARFNEIE